MIRLVLAISLLMLRTPNLLAQDVYFGDASHSTNLQAIWRPDGTRDAS